MWCFTIASFLLIGSNLGVSQPLNGRIIGGENASIADYPYALQLEYYELVCGAVLVSFHWALTAGNCLYDRDLDVFIIRAGTTDRGVGGAAFSIIEAVYHPDFNYAQNEYNAALLRLNGTVSIPNTDVVQMVSEDSTIPVGSNITVIGWGWINEDYYEYDENFPDILQVVELPIIDDKTCNELESQYGNYTETMFCAGYLKGGKDFCYGDLGGATMFEGLLIGIASWTDNCARENRPGVFTKVAYLRPWIDNIIIT